MAAVVEKFNHHVNIRQDLFGFIDIFACSPGRGNLGVQACVAGDIASRVQKILAEPRARIWLESGNNIAVFGWGLKVQDSAQKGKKDGKPRRKVMALREVRVTIEDWTGVQAAP